MITKKEFIVLIISFVVGFFLTHPMSFDYDKLCRTNALFLSCAFAFLNMQIYAFFTNASIWNPIAWEGLTKSLVEDNSNKNRVMISFDISGIANPMGMTILLIKIMIN